MNTFIIFIIITCYTLISILNRFQRPEVCSVVLNPITLHYSRSVIKQYLEGSLSAEKSTDSLRKMVLPTVHIGDDKSSLIGENKEKEVVSSTEITKVSNTSQKQKVERFASSICADYTTYLKSISSDINKPFVVDVIATLVTAGIEIYIIIATGHMQFYYTEKQFDYTLTYKEKTYTNLFNRLDPNVAYIDLKYLIPHSLNEKEGDVIEFSLRDCTKKRIWPSVKVCLRVPAKTLLPLGFCAYASTFNTMNWIRYWIAFTRIQHASKVILYVSDSYPELQTELKSLVEEGYLELWDFSWYRSPKTFPTHIQYNNQQAQMNSCFYRHKHEIEFLINCDIDEFIHSEKYPYHLYDAIASLFKQNPSKDFISIQTTRYTNMKNAISIKDREIALNNGTLFDLYPYQNGPKAIGAMKMVIRNSFEGTLGTHLCFFCNSYGVAPMSILRLAHYKATTKYGVSGIDKTMTLYTPSIQEELSRIREKK